MCCQFLEWVEFNQFVHLRMLPAGLFLELRDTWRTITLDCS